MAMVNAVTVAAHRRMDLLAEADRLGPKISSYLALCATLIR